MAAKLLARIAAPSLEEAARDLAVAIAAACDAEDGDVVLVGPFDAIRHESAVIALRVMLARQAGRLFVSNIVPVGIDFRSPEQRTRLRDAVIEELGRHCHVRAFNSAHDLVVAAREPQIETPQLLHQRGIITCTT